MHPHDTTSSKYCHKCGRTLPTDCFSRDRRSRDELQSKCKDCNRAYRDTHKEQSSAYFRDRYAADSERIGAANRARYASNPQRNAEYRAANRERRKEQSRAWHAANKEHSAEYDRQYRRANREQRSETWHAWYETNKARLIARGRAVTNIRRGRVRNAEGTHTIADIRAQHARQKGRCYWCGKAVGKAYHVDHIVPLSRGGSNWPDNLVIACPQCNLSKGNKLPHEWTDGGRLL